ncbi:hypothetical protein BKA83DRAFT_4063243 [Pisolithus microcarpus]|nr:hypothetical protein BKA83DRAFT_4063243 [Pisolithus microcarpus]
MSSQPFFIQKHQRKLVQPPPLPRAKVSLTQEAREEFLAQRRSKKEHFKQDLDNTWQQIDDATKTIALANHKSVNRVRRELYLGHNSFHTRRSKLSAWNAFCWKKKKEYSNVQLPGGKSALPALVRKASEEYKSLSMEEKKALIEEYARHKERKTFGLRATAKSKVNDITETLKAVENELTSLQYRTGAETVLYMTRGSTDLPLRGVAFATEGVENFMGTVMRIDNQDLVSKMEGFAVQGVKGAAANYQQHVSQVRGAIREIINAKLQEITGQPNAKMQWAHYFRNVVTRYLVSIEGWPDRIPFTNLSTISSALPDLEMLLRKWEAGSTFWKLLNNQDYEVLCRECDAKLNSGELVEGTRRTRSDKGTKRTGQNRNATKNSRRTFKSSETIITDNEDNGDEEDGVERDTTHTPAEVAATPGDKDVNRSAVRDTNADTSSDTGVNTTNRLMLATGQTHQSTAPYSVTGQASCSTTYYPDPSLTLRILEINLDLALRNLDENYNAMWPQGGSGDTYRFDDQDGYGFDNAGRYRFGDGNSISFGD